MTSRKEQRANIERQRRSAAKIKWWEENGGFVYWRDKPGTIHVPYGTLSGRKAKEKKLTFVVQYDNQSQQEWLAQLSQFGEIHIRKHKTVKKMEDGKYVGVAEDRYTEDQYDLIRVALWYLNNGWKAKEVYVLLTHPSIAFPLYPGQTPLTAAKIRSWKLMYVSNLTRGFLWP